MGLEETLRISDFLKSINILKENELWLNGEPTFKNILVDKILEISKNTGTKIEGLYLFGDIVNIRDSKHYLFEPHSIDVYAKIEHTKRSKRGILDRPNYGKIMREELGDFGINNKTVSLQTGFYNPYESNSKLEEQDIFQIY